MPRAHCPRHLASFALSLALLGCDSAASRDRELETRFRSQLGLPSDPDAGVERVVIERPLPLDGLAFVTGYGRGHYYQPCVAVAAEIVCGEPRLGRVLQHHQLGERPRQLTPSEWGTLYQGTRDCKLVRSANDLTGGLSRSVPPQVQRTLGPPVVSIPVEGGVRVRLHCIPVSFSLQSSLVFVELLVRPDGRFDDRREAPF